MFIEFDNELINTNLIVSVRSIHTNYCILINMSNNATKTEYFGEKQERDTRYNEIVNLLIGFHNGNGHKN